MEPSEKLVPRYGRPFPYPPRPNDGELWEYALKFRSDLAPAREKAFESEIRGVVDGVDRKLDSIPYVGLFKILGNGVVPQQAATALAILYERIANNESTS